MIVTPDASVLLKWVLPGDDEQDTGAALALRDEAAAGTLDLVVPQLWIYEVGNTLARRFPEDADELLASLADFGLTEARLDAKVESPRRVPVGEVRCRVLRRGLPCRGARPPGRVRHGGRRVCAPRLGGRGHFVSSALADALNRQVRKTSGNSRGLRRCRERTGTQLQQASASGLRRPARVRVGVQEGRRPLTHERTAAPRQPHRSHSCQPAAGYRNPSAGVRACTSSTSTSRETRTKCR